MIIINVIGFIIAAAIMIKAGDFAVKSITAIGKNLNVGHFLLSFLLVGLVAAFPEGFVSILSAAQGVPRLGFGALQGSVVADLLLVIGLVGIIGVKSKVNKGFDYEIWLLFLLMLPIGLAFDGVITRVDGIILVGSAILFFYNLVHANHLVEQLVHSDKRHLSKHALYFAGAAMAVFASAHFVVYFAQRLSVDLNLPIIVVGLIMIALATSLPELVFAVQAARNKLADVAIGELFGVLIIDGAFLTGIVAIIHPIMVPTAEITKLGIFIFAGIAMATYFIRRDHVFTWVEGLVMVFFYLIFVVTELTTFNLFPT